MVFRRQLITTAVVLFATITLAAIPYVEGATLMINKCCVDDELLATGFGRCRPRKDGQLPRLPPVHSATNDSVLVITDDEVQVNHEMITCADGFIAKSTINFTFYQNGQMVVTSERTQVESGTFCLHETEAKQFAALYCVPDPCRNASCVHKCCPNGMAVNETTRSCQADKAPLQVMFRDESGKVITLDPSSYILRDEAVPQCLNGITLLNPADGDEFYILPESKRLYMPHYLDPADRYFDDYCIDHFLHDNGTWSLKALSCHLAEPEEHLLIFSIYPYFLIISSFFLIVTLVVYILLPELRNIHGLTIICYVLSITILYIGLSTIMLAVVVPDVLCVGMAVFVHFAFIATFSWLNVMSFDIWWTFSPMSVAKPEAVSFWMSNVFSGRKDDSNDYPKTLDHAEDSDSDTHPIHTASDRHPKLRPTFLFYSVYGWGVPFLIVAVGQTLENLHQLPEHIITPKFGLMKCWFHDPESTLAYLYGPVAVLIVFNIIFFVMTAVALCRTRNSSASRYFTKQKFCSIFSIFVLMGLFWMTEIISYYAGGSLYFWIPTDLLNILTGIFVFFIFVCRPNVWRLLKIKFPRLQRLDRCCPSCMKEASDMPVTVIPPSASPAV